MIYVNIPKAEYANCQPSKQRNGIQYYYARFNEKENDGIVHAVEVEIDHEPTAEDFANLQASYLAKQKHFVQVAIDAHDKSEDVNSFLLNGASAWVDKATRVGLRNSIQVEKAAGKTETVVYLNGVAYTIPVDKALAMLDAIELYAIDCYRKTEEHKANVAALTDAYEVQAYNYCEGYPEKLSFEV